MTTNCPQCGHPAEAGAVFCDNCGVDLRTAAPQVSVPAPASAPAPQATGGGVVCSSCGFSNVAGASFCENCGTPLGQGQLAQPSVPQPVAPQPPPFTPVQPSGPVFVTGRLVIQGSNASLSFPAGKAEIIIGREDPVSSIFPDIDLELHGGQDAGVGRKHARLTSQSGQVYVDDLNSVNGTFINKQKVIPGQPRPVNNGDELRFGKVAANYYTS